MKQTLFATAAAMSLAFAGVAFAQTENKPEASPPPVQTPTEMPDPNLDGAVGASVETPLLEGVADADVAVDENQTDVEAQANATAASPATPAYPANAVPAATLANASDVCQPRVTSVHFGRSSALSRDNSNAIEQAVDAASVCSLQQVTIAASGEGRAAERRAQAIRATLVRQGVPEDRIVVDANAAPDGVSTGQTDVRMAFAGVASAGASPSSVDVGAEANAVATPVEPTGPSKPDDMNNEDELQPAS